MKNKKNYLMMLVLSLIVVTLVGCGKKEEDTATETTTTEVTEDTVADTEPTEDEMTQKEKDAQKAAEILEENRANYVRVESLDGIPDENFLKVADMHKERFGKDIKIVKAILVDSEDAHDNTWNTVHLFYEIVDDAGNTKYSCHEANVNTFIEDDIQPSDLDGNGFPFDTLEEAVEYYTQYDIVFDEKDF